MELKVDIQYEQLLTLIKQLPHEQKLMLAKELEKEAIDTKLSQLLQTFQTNELTEECIDREVEAVRQEFYEQRKKQ